MGQVLVDENKLDRILQELATIRRVVMPQQDATIWVKLATLKKETNLSFEQIRYARVQNVKIARKKGNGRYEYDLTAYKKIAA